MKLVRRPALKVAAQAEARYPSRMRLPIAFIAIVVLKSSSALAGGGGVIRELTSSTFDSCQSGKLMEHYHEYGNIHGGSEEIQIACLTSPTRAAWLWMAATECEGSKVCPKRRRPPAPFAYPSGHYIAGRPEGQSSPKTMTYNVKQATRGTDCSLSSYKTEYEEQFYWACSQYKALYDLDQLMTVIATGPLNEVDDSDEKTPKLPLQLTAPASDYTVNEATSLIDSE